MSCFVQSRNVRSVCQFLSVPGASRPPERTKLGASIGVPAKLRCMTGWPRGFSLGSSQLLFPDQPQDSSQTFVANNIGLTHGDGLVSDLALQSPFPGTQFDTTIGEFEHAHALLA